MRMSSIGLSIWIFGPQLIAELGRFRKYGLARGNRRFHSPFPVPSLCFLIGYEGEISQLPAPNALSIFATYSCIMTDSYSSVGCLGNGLVSQQQ